METTRTNGESSSEDTPPQGEGQPKALSSILSYLESYITADLLGFADILRNKRRMMWLNFLYGIARGAGFFIGITIVGVILAGFIIFFLERAVDIPLIGEYIARLIMVIKENMATIHP